MRRPRGMLIIVPGALLALPLLAGCTAEPPVLSMDGGVRCVDSAATGEAYAAFSITNSGGATTLRALDLGQADGLEVIDASVVPLDHGEGLDISPRADAIPNWDARTPAIGSALPEDATVQLVLQLRSLDPAKPAFLVGVSVFANRGQVGLDDAVVGITPGGSCPAEGDIPGIPPADGAGLVLGSGVGTICASSSGGDDGYTFGFPVTNLLDEKEWLQGVHIDGVAGVDVLGTWIVDRVVGNDDADANTTWTDDYPPGDGTFGAGGTRHVVHGYALDGGHTTWVAIAIALEPGATQGSISGIRLRYGNDPDGGAIGAVNGGDVTIGIGPEGADGRIQCE